MSDKIVRALNTAGARFGDARDSLSNTLFDLQFAVERLLPMPEDVTRLEPLLSHAELRMAESRGAFERLMVRYEQLRQLAAVAARK